MNQTMKILVFTIVALLASSVAAAEEKISRSQVPDAVLRSFAASYPNATAKNYARETKDGKTYYEIESQEGSISRDLLFEPDGRLAEAEEKIPFDSLPAPVKNLIASKYGQDSFVSAERIRKYDRTTYGVMLKIDNRTQEKVFNPDGSLVNEAVRPNGEGERDESKEQPEEGW